MTALTERRSQPGISGTFLGSFILDFFLSTGWSMAKFLLLKLSLSWKLEVPTTDARWKSCESILSRDQEKFEINSQGAQREKKGAELPKSSFQSKLDCKIFNNYFSCTALTSLIGPSSYFPRENHMCASKWEINANSPKDELAQNTNRTLFYQFNATMLREEKRQPSVEAGNIPPSNCISQNPKSYQIGQSPTRHAPKCKYPRGPQ
jgi:hypothetical protein